MSDGDNLCTWRGYFRSYFNDPLHGTFPIAWGMGPTLIDVAPTIAQWYYQHATPNDEFLCDVSGVGYIYPPDFGDRAQGPRRRAASFLWLDPAVHAADGHADRPPDERRHAGHPGRRRGPARRRVPDAGLRLAGRERLTTKSRTRCRPASRSSGPSPTGRGRSTSPTKSAAASGPRAPRSSTRSSGTGGPSSPTSSRRWTSSGRATSR